MPQNYTTFTSETSYIGGFSLLCNTMQQDCPSLNHFAYTILSGVIQPTPATSEYKQHVKGSKPIGLF